MAKLHPATNFRHLNCAGRLLDLTAEPAVMGVLNLTPDSFSDGGRYGGKSEGIDHDKALQSALGMAAEGAVIIDIGGESTRPGSEPVSAEEEIRRTVPLIARLRERSDVLISIDTWKSEVAEAALEAGADIVNDISGLTFDPSMPETCGRRRCGVVVMHTAVRPESMRWSHDTCGGGKDVLHEVAAFLKRSIELARRHGIGAIIADPGFGFGKSVEENFELLTRLDELHTLGCPILAGLSRKSFLGQAVRREGEPIPPPSSRDNATTCANTIALLNGADILRVHDVKAAVEARAVVKATRNTGARP
jgi:dihydropteroate synthase